MFRDREICDGSLVECLNKALIYAKYHNMTRGVITSNPARIDQKDYPGDSIREALINGIIHKDYYINGSTRLEFFDMPTGLTEQEKVIYAYVRKNGSVMRKEVSNILVIGETRAKTLIKQMINMGIIEKSGDNKNTMYKIME